MKQIQITFDYDRLFIITSMTIFMLYTSCNFETYSLLTVLFGMTLASSSISTIQLDNQKRIVKKYTISGCYKFNEYNSIYYIIAVVLAFTGLGAYIVMAY